MTTTEPSRPRPVESSGSATGAELTVRAVVLGLILSVVMGAANVYLGLKAGMTVASSIPAAVIAMLILRKVLRGGTILEANQVQTAASAGESLAAGIIFTMPALILIGVWQQFDMLLTTVIAATGGLLGILFMIPMRRVFVLGGRPELKFPEGVACAVVLRTGDASTDRTGAIGVLVGAVLGSVFKLAGTFFGLIRPTLEGAAALGSRVFYFGADISPALVAVGLIVRLPIALLIFAGGAISWLIAIPLLSSGASNATALDDAWALWSSQIRYIGVGAMVVGGIASIVTVREGLFEAVRQLSANFRPGRRPSSAAPAHDRDIPAPLIVGLLSVATLLVGLTYYSLTQHAAIAVVTTIIMVVMAFFFTAVASYIVGLVGSSNSPVSGMTITAVLFTGGLLMVFGFGGTEGMVATLGVAAIVCCAACTSGDICNDLKTGHMVGASPAKQQVMQICGVVVAAFVMAPVLQLLHDNTPGGIGGRELAAPQASLFASLARGFFGDGQLPWNMVMAGAVVGVVILIVDAMLARRRSVFRMHLMPVAVGMYLPFGLATPILIGGLLAHAIARGHDEDAAEARMGRGVLFASGIIAGESLMGVGLALLAAIGWQRVALLPESSAAVTGLTIAGAIAMIYAFRRYSRPR